MPHNPKGSKNAFPSRLVPGIKTFDRTFQAKLPSNPEKAGSDSGFGSRGFRVSCALAV